MNETVEECLKSAEAAAYGACSDACRFNGIHSVVFRKSDGGTVVTHHESRDAALETAAEIRAAFPWVPVSIVPGAVEPAERD